MWNWFKKDNKVEENKETQKEPVIKNCMKYFEYMKELQEKLSNNIITFEETKQELEKVTPGYIKINCESGKLIKIGAVGDKRGDTYVTAIYINSDGYIASINIEGTKINDFNLETDDVSKLENRKIDVLIADNNNIIKIY